MILLERFLKWGFLLFYLATSLQAAEMGRPGAELPSEVTPTQSPSPRGAGRHRNHKGIFSKVSQPRFKIDGDRNEEVQSRIEGVSKSIADGKKEEERKNAKTFGSDPSHTSSREANDLMERQRVNIQNQNSQNITPLPAFLKN